MPEQKMGMGIQMAEKVGDKVGAVMVVEGGVAGIQASLDLAESGYYVYLVESSAAIGGSWPSWTRHFQPMTAPCASSLLNWSNVDVTSTLSC